MDEVLRWVRILLNPMGALRGLIGRHGVEAVKTVASSAKGAGKGKSAGAAPAKIEVGAGKSPVPSETEIEKWMKSVGLDPGPFDGAYYRSDAVIENSELTEFNLPAGFYIMGGLFIESNSALTKITIPDGVNVADMGGFTVAGDFIIGKNPLLTTITIGKDLTVAEDMIIAKNPALKKIRIDCNGHFQEIQESFYILENATLSELDFSGKFPLRARGEFRVEGNPMLKEIPKINN